MARKFARLKEQANLPGKVLPLEPEDRYVVFSDHHKTSIFKPLTITRKKSSN